MVTVIDWNVDHTSHIGIGRRLDLGLHRGTERKIIDTRRFDNGLVGW